MQCYVYKSLNKEGLYLYVEKPDDFSRVPETFFKGLGKPILVMQLELTPQRKLARVDVCRVMQQIEEKGFFVQIPPSTLPPSETIQ